jgi:hypothetical protein
MSFCIDDSIIRLLNVLTAKFYSSADCPSPDSSGNPFLFKEKRKDWNG